MSKKFVIIGMGFIFDRHIQAIRENKGEIVGVCDIDPTKKYKANGIPFYKNWKEMLEKEDYDWVVICTPNHLHWEMADYALRKFKKRIICEKPPIISKQEYNLLEDDNDFNIVLQCRYSKPLAHLEERLRLAKKKDVKMQIEVHRDDWYMDSWKADPQKSGGLLYNIGCHYFDLLCWWFGEAREAKLDIKTDKRMEGWIRFDKAFVDFSVAIDAPIDAQKRIIKIGAEEFNLTQLGFESLHGEVYKNILKGNGYKLRDFKKAQEVIEMLYDSRKK